MRSPLRFPSLLTVLAIVILSLGLQLSAQQSQSSQQDEQQQQTQPPSRPTSPDAQSPSRQSQSPDQSQSQSPSDPQVFTGVIVKQGDKYMLQTENGTTYDIDRQDLAKNHEGKAVRVPGTLDPNGKLIHVH